LALYATKETGPNGYQFYRSSMTEEMSERRQIEIDLRDAMERNELELHYQPIVSMRDKKLRGFEAARKVEAWPERFRAACGLYTHR
jgi:predicted signal transduction protein with EAL and GGDEF domain